MSIADSSLGSPRVLTTARRVLRWERVVMLAGAVGFVVLLRSLPRADWPALIAQLGPVLPATAGIALAWMAFYARGLQVVLGGGVGWARLVYNRVIGEAYNVIAPVGDVGGDPIRILDLAGEVGTANAARAIVLDRLVYATSGLLFSAGCSAAAVLDFAWERRFERLLLAYALVASVAALALFVMATRPAMARAIGRLLSFARVRLPETPAPLPTRTFARALGWHLLGRAGVVVEIAALLAALDQPVRLDALVATSALVAVAGVVFFFIPNGVGVNEGAAVFALSLAGYGETVGLAVGLARRARQLLMTAVGVALPLVWRPRQNR